MMKFWQSIAIIALGVSCGTLSASADQGGNAVSYVASTGSDGNSCAYNAPCLTMNAALHSTATGGLIVCLSPPEGAGFAITSSVDIDCEAPAVAAMSIDLPSTDTLQTVHLRGFRYNGNNRLLVGLTITAAKTVILENVSFKFFANQAVIDHRSSPGTLMIKNSTIGPTAAAGVVIAGGAGNTGTLDNVTLVGSTYGVAVAAGNSVSIVHSNITGNSVAGIEADGGSLVIVDSSTISRNNVGIASGSAIRLSNNNLEFNTTAVNGATGTFGNNRFSGNSSDGTALTPVGGSSTDLAQK